MPALHAIFVRHNILHYRWCKHGMIFSKFDAFECFCLLGKKECVKQPEAIQFAHIVHYTFHTFYITYICKCVKNHCPLRAMIQWWYNAGPVKHYKATVFSPHHHEYSTSINHIDRFPFCEKIIYGTISELCVCRLHIYTCTCIRVWLYVFRLKICIIIYFGWFCL